MARGRGKATPQDIEAMKHVSVTLIRLMEENGFKQSQLADVLEIPRSSFNEYVKGNTLPKPGNVQKIADFFGLLKSDIDPRFLSNITGNEKNNTLQAINAQLVQLHPKRQKNVLEFTTEQLKEQNNIISIEEVKDTVTKYIIEDNQTVKETELNYPVLTPVKVVESLAAGRGYSYMEQNETYDVYTDKENLKGHDIASFVTGDSMIPDYKDGDVVLIKKGYDNVQGGVYAIDYNGKSYLKRVYNEGNRFKLVSINSEKYEPFYIDVPVDEDIYFNIIGSVVDSFTPIEK
ncbi:helix-turn-helix domain-containing protein [Carnobacteriaceae bacterium zg-ZUI78]|nr:helix-turn-helix domain-containing protein [Carnobacteriaceae bacterium zg-ZUI78]